MTEQQNHEHPHEIRRPYKVKDELSALMNVGPMTRNDFRILGIESVEQLAQQDADELYDRLNRLCGIRLAPCQHDVFAATIHQAKSGEALAWWTFSKARKGQ